MRKLPLAVLVLTALLFANQAAHAQMGTDNNPMAVKGWDSVANQPCPLGGLPFNTNCKLPDGGSSSGGSANVMGWDGTAWQKVGAALNGSTYQLDIEALAGSNLINTLNGATPAGTNYIGQFGPGAVATGGASSSHAQSAASTNATLVSTGAHTLYNIAVINPTTTVACFHTYDNATSPTVGTTTIKHTYTVGAVSTAGQAGGAVIPFPVGELYALGLAYSMTGSVSNTCTDADTSNAPLGVDIELSWK